MYVGPGRCGDNVIGHLRQRRRYTLLYYALFTSVFYTLQNCNLLHSRNGEFFRENLYRVLWFSTVIQLHCAMLSIGFQNTAESVFQCKVNSVKLTVQEKKFKVHSCREQSGVHVCAQSEHSAKSVQSEHSANKLQREQCGPCLCAK